jgi:hypothetical protein
MFGRLPWFALLRRMRAFFFFVFFDMACDPSGRAVSPLLARSAQTFHTDAPRNWRPWSATIQSMSNQFDDLFEEHAREQRARDADAERYEAWEQWLAELTVALQPVADAAIAHGHQAAVTRLPNRIVEFEIRFKEHPMAPASCSFAGIFPPGGEIAVYVDSNGPGKLDDPRDPMRRPLSRFSMDDACNYVASMIRSASKLLP